MSSYKPRTLKGKLLKLFGRSKHKKNTLSTMGFDMKLTPANKTKLKEATQLKIDNFLAAQQIKAQELEYRKKEIEAETFKNFEDDDEEESGGKEEENHIDSIVGEVLKNVFKGNRGTQTDTKRIQTEISEYREETQPSSDKPTTETK